MYHPPQEVLKARCDSLGLCIRLLFWLYALYLAVMLCAGLWLAGQSGSGFTLALLDTGNGLAGYGFYHGGWEVDFARDALNPSALAAPKAVYLAGYFGGFAEKLLRLGMLGCVAGLFKQIDQGSSPFLARGCRAIARVGFLLILTGFVRAGLTPALLGLLGCSGGGLAAGQWWSSLLAGGVVLCLSYMFEYGAALQAESDETL